MMNEFNPDGKDIRFIDSHYRDLFRIPDGGTIQVHYSDDSVVIKPCKFIDEYHTQIGNNVFHICQFAELLERNGSYCQAEPEIMGDEAAWQVGRDQYLAIQTCEDGYDYTLFDKEFHEIDGGQLDNPELSMLEARAEILAGFGLQMRELRVQVYEEVMEKAEAVEAVNASLLDLAKQINFSLLGGTTIFTLLRDTGIGGDWYELLLAAFITILAAVLLRLFLGTRLGLSIRATGDNQDMVRASSLNPNFTITVGLCIANSLTALSGAIVGQYQKTVDINSGTGIVVIGLACLIIGETLLGRRTVTKGVIAVILGSIVYRFIYAIVFYTKVVPVECLKLLTAVIVALAIAAPSIKKWAAFQHRKLAAQRRGGN